MTGVVRAAALAVLASCLGGCFWLVAGGAAEGGYVAAQDDRSAGQTVSDQWIFTKVKTELVASSVKSRNIKVKVRRGVVTLKGVVDSGAEKAEALRLTRRVDGVRGVVDKLFVEK